MRGSKQRSESARKKGKAASPDYYEDGASWEYSQFGSMKRQRNVAFMFAGAALAVAGLSVAAVAAITPLKTVEPFVVTVDQTTGYLELTRGLERSALSEEQAITEANLVRYVTNRESYNPHVLEANFNDVMLHSAGIAAEDFNQSWSRNNPNNPAARYGWDSRVTVQIKSISFLNENTASIRFQRTERGRSGNTVTHWAAIATFRYVAEPVTMRERFANPLGFQVTEYRLNQESMPE